MAPRRAAFCAERLIGRFGSLGGVLAASPAAVGQVVDCDPDVTAYLSIIRAAMLETLRHEAVEGICFPTSRELLDYLHAGMARLPAEQFRVLFLAADHRLLGDEVIGFGSIAEVPMYPREVVRRALELGAVELILVHNHPSGNPAPSSADIAATRHVVDAARTFGIVVLEHLIIARTGYASLRELGYL